VDDVDDILAENGSLESNYNSINSMSDKGESLQQLHTAASKLGRLIARLLRVNDFPDEPSSPSLIKPSLQLGIDNTRTQDNVERDVILLRRPFWYSFVYESQPRGKKMDYATSPIMAQSAAVGGVLQLQLFHNNERTSSLMNSRQLSVKNEVELLRAQRSRCLGCGEPLFTGLGMSFLGSWGLGVHKNFAPCRYYGGLFCKRWCHRDDHRVIPYRMLLYWDGKPHRVCRQAAVFLDEFATQPLLNVSELSPLLFEGVPLLRKCYRMRTQIAFLMDTLINHQVQLKKNKSDANSNGNASNTSLRTREEKFMQLRDILMECLGQDSKMHLCVAAELYSLQDLVHVQSGSLLVRLDKLLLALFTLLDVEKHV
jgi:hypothetical protein